MSDVFQESTGAAGMVTMYATRWCGDCRRARRWLDAHGIAYTMIDIDRDAQAAAYVMQINGGMRSVPTIVFSDGSILVEPTSRELAARYSQRGKGPGQEEERTISANHEGCASPGRNAVSSPRFAAFYTWMMGRPVVRRMFDPLRREIVARAHGVVLEVGAGGGQNFPWYDPTHIERVEAVEPDEAMLARARHQLEEAPVPITLTRTPVETLPFPDAQFECAVATLVFCSVDDPERGLHEVWRVLKPGGSLLLLEHVRAQGSIAAWMQDVLVPVTTRCLGHCHWNRDTLRTVVRIGFQITQVRQFGGGLQPMVLIHARRPHSPEETHVCEEEHRSARNVQRR